MNQKQYQLDCFVERDSLQAVYIIRFFGTQREQNKKALQSYDYKASYVDPATTYSPTHEVQYHRRSKA